MQYLKTFSIMLSTIEEGIMVRKFKVSDFNKALIIAQSDVSINEHKHSLEPLYGCGLSEFKAVVTTIETVARHIRWQAARMDGTWDINEIETIKWIAKKKF